MVSICAAVCLVWLGTVCAYKTHRYRRYRPKNNLQISSATSIFYDLQLRTSAQLQLALSGHPQLSSLSLLAFGMLSALTPCTLGMLPVTLAYLGKYDKSATAVTVSAKCLLFGAGIAVVYTTLGVSAAAFGTVFGSYVSAPIFGLLSGLLYVAMGLSLMGLLSLKLPSIDLPGGVPGSNAFAGAFTLGASSALLEAPCTSPILGALLTYLASSSIGAGMSAVDTTLRAAATMALFSIGYATPLVVAGALGGKVISAVFTSRSAAAAEAGMDVLSAALVAWGTYLFLVAGERVLDA